MVLMIPHLRGFLFTAVLTLPIMRHVHIHCHENTNTNIPWYIMFTLPCLYLPKETSLCKRSFEFCFQRNATCPICRQDVKPDDRWIMATNLISRTCWGEGGVAGVGGGGLMGEGVDVFVCVDK